MRVTSKSSRTEQLPCCIKINCSISNCMGQLSGTNFPSQCSAPRRSSAERMNEVPLRVIRCLPMLVKHNEVPRHEGPSGYDSFCSLLFYQHLIFPNLQY